MNISKWLWPLIFLAVLLLGFVSYPIFLAPYLEDKAELKPSNGEAGLVLPAVTLQSSLGDYALLKPDGKLRILYFGYTHCPDICPTSLSVLASALYQMNESQLAQIEPIFITVDPSRDDAKKMAEYAAFFHPQLRGLTGDKSQIDLLASQLGVLYHYVTMSDSVMEYAVDHSSYFYFISDDGRLLQRLAHTYDPKPIIQAIEANINK